MGQGVVWYTGQFYAQNFLETKCFLEFEQSRTIMLWAIAFATPFFLVFGWLSDKIGRKWIMMTGMALAIFSYRPIFSIFLNDTNVKKIVAENPALPGQIIKTDTIKLDALSYILHQKYLYNSNGIKFTKESRDTVYFTGTIYPPLSALGGDNKENLTKELVTDSKPIFTNVVLPTKGYWKFIGLVFLLILYVTMVYGPIAAFLVEMFPTKIRYTSMSLPYHIGNGVFGGLVPFIGLLLTSTYTADPLVGLWYPIGVAALCLVIGTLYLTNKIDKNIKD